MSSASEGAVSGIARSRGGSGGGPEDRCSAVGVTAGDDPAAMGEVVTPLDVRSGGSGLRRGRSPGVPRERNPGFLRKSARGFPRKSAGPSLEPAQRGGSRFSKNSDSAASRSPAYAPKAPIGS